MSIDEEYKNFDGSWSYPIEQVNYSIMKEKKKNEPHHTLENHLYHMQKYKRCVYCDNNIPLEVESDDE